MMNTNFDIDKILKAGAIKNELDFERALVADKKLRVLAKENPQFEVIRKKLRDIIEKYENEHWNSVVDQKRVEESDLAEIIADKENLFIAKRKSLIKSKLKELNMTQQDLSLILGHKGKTYISELINGLCPFSLKDIVIISRLLKIDIQDMIPVFLSSDDQQRIKSAIEKINKPNLKLNKRDLELA